MKTSVLSRPVRGVQFSATGAQIQVPSNGNGKLVWLTVSQSDLNRRETVDAMVAFAGGKGELHLSRAGSIKTCADTMTAWEESDFIHVEKMAALGRLFERVHSAGCAGAGPSCQCAGMSPAWRAWCEMTTTLELCARRKAAMAANDAAKEAAKFAGQSAAEICAAIRAAAEDDYEGDAYGQTLPHQFLAGRVDRAVRAGLPVEELVAEVAAAEAQWQRDLAANAAAAQVRQAAFDAWAAPIIAASAAFPLGYRGRVVADYRGVSVYTSEYAGVRWAHPDGAAFLAFDETPATGGWDPSDDSMGGGYSKVE